MTTVPQLEAELAGEEKAIRLLIGERAALSSHIARAEAQEKLLATRIKAETTRGHPVVGTATAHPFKPADRFPDVSSYQPNVEWAAVRNASSVRVGALAITKLSEGAGWVDHFGLVRLNTMKALGFVHRGAYHFLHPSVSPTAQAEHFLEAGGHELGPYDVAICDAEVSDGEPARMVAAAVAQFGATLAKHIGAERWLYSGGPFAHEYELELGPNYESHWLAAYVNNPTPYKVFGSKTVAWQYTDGVHGPVPHVCPGIGACDLSIVL